jgi:hypothetical protein
MNIRWYSLLVVLFWAASCSWLFQAKILPAFIQGHPPDYGEEFSPERPQQTPAVGWELFWNQRPVGFVISRPVATADDTEEIRTLVKFENMSIREVMRDLLGGFALLQESFLDVNDAPLELTAATRLVLDWNHELQSFQTSLQTDNHIDLLLVRGHRTDDNRLRLSLFSGDAAEPIALGPLGQELPLPENARIAEAFSPRSRLPGLRVGQMWTTPVVMPVAASQMVRLVETRVAAREDIEWRGRPIAALRLEYRQHGGSPSGSHEVTGMAWVDPDGIVVRQELTLGSARIRLERLSEGESAVQSRELESHIFDRYLHRSHGQSASARKHQEPQREGEASRD